MLIKRKTLLNPKQSAVKKSAIALALTAFVTAMGQAPYAFAGDSPLVDQVVTVKFSAAELSSKNGVQTVYAKLEKKAKRVCRRDGASLIYMRKSQRECAEDLMDQFITNANIESLKSYHLSSKSETEMDSKSDMDI